jgi:hypothetical protein
MSSHRLRSVALALTATAALHATPAGAQSLIVGPSAISSSNAALPPGAGVTAALSLPISRVFAVTLGFDAMRGSSRQREGVCAGLVGPSGCPEEPSEREGRFHVFRLGVDVPLMRSSRFAASIRPDLLAGGASTKTRGLETGDQLSDSQTEYGFGVAATIAFRPIGRLPFVLTLDASIADMGFKDPPMIVDGYTPFSTGNQIRRLTFAIGFSR